MATTINPPLNPCNGTTSMNDPCVKQFVQNYNPLDGTYQGDIPCLPPEQTLDCTTIGVGTLTAIADTQAGIQELINNLNTDPLSVDTLLSIANLI